MIMMPKTVWLVMGFKMQWWKDQDESPPFVPPPLQPKKNPLNSSITTPTPLSLKMEENQSTPLRFFFSHLLPLYRKWGVLWDKFFSLFLPLLSSPRMEIENEEIFRWWDCSILWGVTSNSLTQLQRGVMSKNDAEIISSIVSTPFKIFSVCAFVDRAAKHLFLCGICVGV